jgi:hypothetical protein
MYKYKTLSETSGGFFRIILNQNTNVMNKPVYKHNCSQCIFLGNYAIEGKVHDLYYCPQITLPTVIARHGNEGPDYSSSIEIAVSQMQDIETYHLPLPEALRRAYKKRLITFAVKSLE